MKVPANILPYNACCEGRNCSYFGPYLHLMRVTSLMAEYDKYLCPTCRKHMEANKNGSRK